MKQITLQQAEAVLKETPATIVLFSEANSEKKKKLIMVYQNGFETYQVIYNNQIIYIGPSLEDAVEIYNSK